MAFCVARAYDIHLRQLQGVLDAVARLTARRWKFNSISPTSLPLAVNPATCRTVCACVQLPPQPSTQLLDERVPLVPASYE